VQDGVVPRSNLGAALAKISQLSQQYGIQVANVFHAGDGNLHPLIFFDARTPGELHKAEAMASQILHLCIDLGGSITGEHGVGLEKRAYLPQMFGEEDMATMTRLRRAMDPKEIANRGKMLAVNDEFGMMNDESQKRSDTGFADQVVGATSKLARPASVAEVQEAVRSFERVALRGGGSKPGMAAAGDGVTVLDMRGLSGIVEYEPDEFVFTALAGTPLAEIAALLAQHGQYLPFDPPFVDAGATLGGAAAAGLSGPRRYRYGGLRDFVIGVRFVDGRGDLVRGGGKVVKNAAGFDLPKLLVGSLGRLGALVELSVKVFPQPAAFATLRADFTSLVAAVDAITSLTARPLDIEAIDLEPAADGGSLLVRIGGRADLLRPRVERLQSLLGRGEPLHGDVERDYWRGVDGFCWAAGSAALVKTPLNALQVGALDQKLAGLGLRRRYSVAGNAAWIALPQADQLPSLDSALTAMNLGGVVVRGQAGRPLLGVRNGEPFYRRVKQALDPDGRFGEL
jgi:glycolate oxidase FAD binding subunit